QAPIIDGSEVKKVKEETSSSSMRDMNDLGEEMGGEDDDEEDDEVNLSLAAMEHELCPQVVDTLDFIAETYVKLRELQDQQVESSLSYRKAESLSSEQRKQYTQLKDALIQAVKSLSLNQNRIEALVEQLYDINKRLIQSEGKLKRLASNYGIG
ncbi:MAG: RNA polymerase sigma factor RpoD, partial [Bartonella sp.]|nr:RNA polymerase sigma factor RpoD [Bartonella sp.]